MNIADYFSTTVSRDLFSLVCGRKLGEGIGREVYVYAPDPTLVVKFETKGESFQNILEWEAWDCLKHHEPTAAWLAPCVAISASGCVLLQKRTQIIGQGQLPERVPEWAWDLKRENWGMLDGRAVMHDYGRCGLISNGATKRLRKAEWVNWT